MFFFQAMVACDIKGVEGTIQFSTKEVWSIFVDEAQALLKMNELNFLSENGANVLSAFSAIVEGLGFLSKRREYLHYIQSSQVQVWRLINFRTDDVHCGQITR